MDGHLASHVNILLILLDLFLKCRSFLSFRNVSCWEYCLFFLKLSFFFLCFLNFDSLILDVLLLVLLMPSGWFMIFYCLFSILNIDPTIFTPFLTHSLIMIIIIIDVNIDAKISSQISLLIVLILLPLKKLLGLTVVPFLLTVTLILFLHTFSFFFYSLSFFWFWVKNIFDGFISVLTFFDLGLTRVNPFDFDLFRFLSCRFELPKGLILLFNKLILFILIVELGWGNAEVSALYFR